MKPIDPDLVDRRTFHETRVLQERRRIRLARTKEAADIHVELLNLHQMALIELPTTSSTGTANADRPDRRRPDDEGPHLLEQTRKHADED